MKFGISEFNLRRFPPLITDFEGYWPVKMQEIAGIVTGAELTVCVKQTPFFIKLSRFGVIDVF